MFKIRLSYLVCSKDTLVFLKGHRGYTPSAVNISSSTCDKPTRIARANSDSCISLGIDKDRDLTAIIMGSETRMDIIADPMMECV